LAKKFYRKKIIITYKCQNKKNLINWLKKISMIKKIKVCDNLYYVYILWLVSLGYQVPSFAINI